MVAKLATKTVLLSLGFGLVENKRVYKYIDYIKIMIFDVLKCMNVSSMGWFCVRKRLSTSTKYIYHFENTFYTYITANSY